MTHATSPASKTASVPHKRRHRSWTTEQVLAIQGLGEEYPCFGKNKLKVLLERVSIVLSASTIGRILHYLKKSGKLKEPLRRITSRRRAWKREYAVRKPREYQALLPGDIIQIDTMDIRPIPGVILKQFTTVDVVSRWSVPTIASNATATLAVKALNAAIACAPFLVRAIQIDGGSEFMAQFERRCKELGIKLFLLPPHSPKLNGRVERANRTYRDGSPTSPMPLPLSLASRMPFVVSNTTTTASAHTKPSATSHPPSSWPPITRRYCHGRLEPRQSLDAEPPISGADRGPDAHPRPDPDGTAPVERERR